MITDYRYLAMFQVPMDSLELQYSFLLKWRSVVYLRPAVAIHVFSFGLTFIKKLKKLSYFHHTKFLLRIRTCSMVLIEFNGTMFEAPLYLPSHFLLEISKKDYVKFNSITM